jgi:hypothetical protein
MAIDMEYVVTRLKMGFVVRMAVFLKKLAYTDRHIPEISGINKCMSHVRYFACLYRLSNPKQT